jgi:hypothetical protein
MKRTLFLAALLFVGTANATPNAVDMQAYKTRAELYVSLGQNSSQIIQSLKNYFGLGLPFRSRSNGWTGTADIIYVEGDGLDITYMETLATSKE